MADAAASDSRFFKIASSIINPDSQVRLKSLINRNNKKDACAWRDPRLDINLLQISVIADNVPAGTSLFFPSTACAHSEEHGSPEDLLGYWCTEREVRANDDS